jgi:basic amino acid/polyamine antiporter, APA family
VSAPDASADIFVRKSTGLVRDLTAFDAFNLVFSAVLIPVGITQVMSFTPQFWPHANMLVSFLFATPLVLCFGLVYLYFTVAMPRSGGDYVWVSRTLHPFLGFVVNVSVTFVFLTWVSFNFTYMLGTMGPGAAYVMGITGSWATAPSKLELFGVSTVLTVLFALLMTRGARVITRYMTATFALVWIGMGVWLIGLAIGGHSDFVTRWNHGAGQSYGSVITSAAKSGFTATGGIGWLATIYAMVYAFQVYTGFQWTGYFAGEIRNARRTATTSIIGGLAASAVIYIAAVALIYHYYGFNFFGALVYNSFGGGTSGIAFAPYLPSLVKFTVLPGALRDLVVLAFVLAIFWWTPTGFMLGTRNLFAWSFDRLMPTGITRVSEKNHTPVVAIASIAGFVELLNYLNVYQNLGAYLLNLIAVLGSAFVVVSIAAMVTPFRKPDLAAAAPGWGNARIVGVPAITLIGLVSAVSWAFVVWTAFHTGFGGTLSWKPMIEAFVPTIVAVVWYIGVSVYRRSQGIDLSRTFEALPPD